MSSYVSDNESPDGELTFIMTDNPADDWNIGVDTSSWPTIKIYSKSNYSWSWYIKYKVRDAWWSDSLEKTINFNFD